MKSCCVTCRDSAIVHSTCICKRDGDASGAEVDAVVGSASGASAVVVTYVISVGARGALGADGSEGESGVGECSVPGRRSTLMIWAGHTDVPRLSHPPIRSLAGLGVEVTVVPPVRKLVCFDRWTK